MENLNIAPTDFTPGADFNLDTLTFRLSGVSRPEDVKDFYDQIINWLKDLEKYFSKNVPENPDTKKINMEFHFS